MNSKVATLILTIPLLVAVFVPSGVSLACTPGMSFVDDKTVPDDTHFAPGASFEKVWRLANSGDCDWTPNYAFAYVGGENLASVSSFLFNTVVSPGLAVDFSLEMRAPEQIGTHTSYWRLVDEASQQFGPTFYVRIVVDDGDSKEGTFLVPERPNVVWLWSAPNGGHEEGDGLPAGRFPVLQKQQDGLWTQIQFGGRTPWVFTGADSGTWEETAGATPATTATIAPTPTLIPTTTPAPTRTSAPRPTSKPTPTKELLPYSAKPALARAGSDGYDWNAASEQDKIELCQWRDANLKRALGFSAGWRNCYDGLNEFYRTNDSFILGQDIGEVDTLLSALSSY